MICLAIKESISSIVGAAGGTGSDKATFLASGTSQGGVTDETEGPALPPPAGLAEGASSQGGTSASRPPRSRGCSSSWAIGLPLGSRSLGSLGRPADVYILPSAPTRPGLF